MSVAPIPPQIVAIEPASRKHHTMRYRFDTDGIHMKWGIIFRREVLLNYSRIQDIHLRSNLIERWLGLARIEIQTASGSASANMTLEGIKEEPEGMRDFLYLAHARHTRDRCAMPSASMGRTSIRIARRSRPRCASNLASNSAPKPAQ